MLNNNLVSILGSVFFLGVSNIFFQKSTRLIGAEATTVWYYIFGALISSIAFVFRTPSKPFQILELKWSFFVAISLLLSVYLFTISLKSMDVSKASTVRSMSFVVTFLILYFFGTEKMTAQRVAGLTLAIVAIFLLK